MFEESQPQELQARFLTEPKKGAEKEPEISGHLAHVYEGHEIVRRLRNRSPSTRTDCGPHCEQGRSTRCSGRMRPNELV